MFSILRRLGCGAVMVAALVAMYAVTQSIIGTAVVTASIGLKQLAGIANVCHFIRDLH